MKAFFVLKVIGTAKDGKRCFVDLFDCLPTKDVVEFFKDAGLTEVPRKDILKNERKRYLFPIQYLERLERLYCFRLGEFKEELVISIKRKR